VLLLLFLLRADEQEIEEANIRIRGMKAISGRRADLRRGRLSSGEGDTFKNISFLR
jgi:hypothetical protein